MPNFLMKYSIEMSLEYCKTLNPSNCSSQKRKHTPLLSKENTKLWNKVMQMIVYDPRETFSSSIMTWFFRHCFPVRKSEGPNDRRASKMIYNSQKFDFFIFVKTLDIHPDGSKSLPKHPPGPKRHLRHPRDVIWKFYPFWKFDFLKLQTRFLNFDVFHSK